MTHTKEPWHVGGDGTIVYDHLGWGIANAVVFHGRPGFVPVANAHRIVACVNACEGSPTEALEEMLKRNLTFGKMAFSYANCQKQRDKLISTLKVIRTWASQDHAGSEIADIISAADKAIAAYQTSSLGEEVVE